MSRGLEKPCYSSSDPQRGMKENRVVIFTDERRLRKCEVQLISLCSRLDCGLIQVLSLDTVMLAPCWNLFMARSQYRVQKPAGYSTSVLSQHLPSSDK